MAYSLHFRTRCLAYRDADVMVSDDDLVARLLARILDPTHEVPRQSLFDKSRRQCRVQHHGRTRALCSRVSGKSFGIDQYIAWPESDFTIRDVDENVSPRSHAGSDFSRIERGKGLSDGIEPLAETWPKRPQIRPDGVRNKLPWILDGFKRFDVQLVEHLIAKSQHRLQHLGIASVNQ